MEQEAIIQDDYIELNKLLKASGLCDTGGHAKIAIAENQVKVDGEVETRTRRKIKHGMTVEYKDNKITVIQEK